MFLFSLCVMFNGMKYFQSNLMKKLHMPDSESLPDLIAAAGSFLLFLPFEWTMVISFAVLALFALKGSLLPVLRRQPGAVWIYGFASLQLFSSLLSENYMGILNSLGTFAVAMMIGLFCQIITPKRFNLMLKTTGYLSGIAAIGGIGEFLYYVARTKADLLFCLVDIPDYVRISLTYFNPNLYSAMIVFFLIICAYLFFISHSIREKLIWTGIAFLNLIVLVMTGSRMAMASLPMIIPVFLFFRKNRKPFWRAVGFEGSLLTGVALNPWLIPRFGKMASVDARFEIWRGALEGISENWILGGGPQYYGMIYQRMFTKKAPHAHNLLLDLLLNSGIIGAGVLMVYLHQVLKMSTSRRLKSDLPMFQPFLICMVSAILIEGLADCTVNFPAPALLILAVMNTPAYLSRAAEPARLFVPANTESVFGFVSQTHPVPVRISHSLVPGRETELARGLQYSAIQKSGQSPPR